MDIMEEVVITKVETHTKGGLRRAGMAFARAGGLGEFEFPIGMPEEEIAKAALSGKDAPVPGSVYDGLTPAQFAVCNFISDKIRPYELKISFEEPEKLVTVERFTVLSAIDKLWQEHLYEMDSLRYSIGLRAHGQRDPLIEYKAEAFKIFDELMVNIKTEICHNIFRSASSLMAFENFLRNVLQQTLHQPTSAFGGTTTGSTTRAAAEGQRRRQRSGRSRGEGRRCAPCPGGPQRPCPAAAGKIQAVLRGSDLRIIPAKPGVIAPGLLFSETELSAAQAKIIRSKSSNFISAPSSVAIHVTRQFCVSLASFGK